MEINTAAVIGLGLMGGSVARELSVRGVRVLGFDIDPLTRVAALRDGVVDAVLPQSMEGIAEAEVIVIAVPVRAALEVLRSLPVHPSLRLVTDVGSTKQSILGVADQLPVGRWFVGAHPVAGDHRSGWEASRLGLFQRARVFLSAAHHATGEAMKLAEGFWRELGGQPLFMPQEAHDETLAWSSHLPQVASSALAVALAGARVERAELGPGGRDATRLAASSPEMWAEIALDNATELEGAVEAMEDTLAGFRRLLEQGDLAALRDWFAAGTRWSAGCRENGGNPVECVAAAPSAG